MTEQEFEEILSFGYESRGVEFKGPSGRLDKHFFAKVVRAVLGMANRRNGGRVILGVRDDGGALVPVGLDTSDLATWKYDDVADGLAGYADPSVTFHLEVVQYKDASYVVLHVAEFEEVPVLCKKDYPDVLRQGACYVRSRRKPETSEVPSQEDMRDLLELATEKRLRRFMSQAQAAGVDLSRTHEPTDEELFDNELGDLEASPILDKIRSRGYWLVRIRPSAFRERRIANISDLYPIVQKASVDIGGWDFPHVDPHEQPHIDIEWVGQESEWSNYLEVWRIYQSGQFVDFFGMPDDWRDQQVWGPAPDGWEPGAWLGVVATVLQFTAIFEFAARLCLTDAGDDVMHIEVTARGLQGRRLTVDDPRRSPLWRVREASISQLPYRVELPRPKLIANPRELALVPAAEFFRRFRWDPGMDLLREIQAQLARR